MYDPVKYHQLWEQRKCLVCSPVNPQQGQLVPWDLTREGAGSELALAAQVPGMQPGQPATGSVGALGLDT